VLRLSRAVCRVFRLVRRLMRVWAHVPRATCTTVGTIARESLWGGGQGSVYGHLLALNTRDLLLHPAVGADDVLNRLKMAHPERQREGVSGWSRCNGRELKVLPERGSGRAGGPGRWKGADHAPAKNQPRVRGRGGMERARKSLQSVLPCISMSRHRNIHNAAISPHDDHTLHFPLDWTWQTHLFCTATQTTGGAFLGTGIFWDK
jgi:hypothetical protein